MKYNQTQTQQVAAARAGMDVKTARKYLKANKLPNELTQRHDWRTHPDGFAKHWDEIEDFLRHGPGLEAKTMLAYLMETYPQEYSGRQLRTLQRRFRQWRAEYGKEKAVIFPQKHLPGRQSQSDFTWMNDLNITIAGAPYPHMLFHFMLVYSRWEDVMICTGESFDNLLHGFEQAVWRLGGVAKDHRTDNLTAAMKPPANRKEFTDKWKKVMKHYRITPSTNNPGVSHENGSVEKSHDLFKKAVNQHLLLRGSRDFTSQEEYMGFLTRLLKMRNQGRAEEIGAELHCLRPLPNDKWFSPKIIPVRVSPASVVNIEGVPYSVPSRLISYSLNAHRYPSQIELYYGNRCIQTMPRVERGALVDYRHVIDSLVRKPGAFHHYQYQAALFPTPTFRCAYDQLRVHSPAAGYRDYLLDLQLAKMHGEKNVQAALELLKERGDLPTADAVKTILDLPQQMPTVHVDMPTLCVYDPLVQQEGWR